MHFYSVYAKNFITDITGTSLYEGINYVLKSTTFGWSQMWNFTAYYIIRVQRYPASLSFNYVKIRNAGYPPHGDDPVK